MPAGKPPPSADSKHRPNYKVFVSSTYLDNKERRRLVQDAITRAGMVWHGMEIFPASTEGAVEECLRYAREADVLVGIIARRYGWIPDGREISITEMEYEDARERLMFLIDPSLPFTEEDLDPPPDCWDKQKKLAAFKQRIQKDQMPAPFRAETLQANVLHSLNKWRALREKLESEAAASGPTANVFNEARHEYCLNVQRRFANIHLFGPKSRKQWGAPDSLERMTRMDLGFVPLHLRDWGEDGGEGAPLDIEALFLTDAPEPPRFLVRGLPGSGKTTLLRHLAHRMASLTLAGAKEWVPVYARLQDFSCHKATLEDWLREVVNDLSADRSVYRALCAQDRFLERSMVLLLDGLDEIEDEKTREKMADLLDELARKNPRCRIIVTSRPIGLDRRNYRKYRPLNLEPLTRGMIDDYLTRWFGDTPDKIASLQTVFRDKPRIFSLAKTPFLLSMICYTFEKPEAAESIGRRSQLYDHCARDLLARAYGPEGPNGQVIDPEATLNILKEIALRFFLWQEADFDVDHVKVMFRRLPASVAGNETTALLRRLERDTGLLQLGPEGFTFVHRTLWEYFTALALIGKKDKDPQFVIRQAANPEWEEIVRLYAGLLDDHGREQDLVDRLWTINRPLALRVTTETRTPAAELLAPLIADKANNRDKLLLIGALEQSLELVGVDEGRSLIEETLRILLIDCGERDCEVVFQAQALLEQNGKRPPLESGGIIYELLDLGHAAARQQTLLDEPGNLFQWVTVQGGIFEMGDDQGDTDEQPIHPVTVTTFQMAKHPVTNGLVKASAEDFPLGPMIDHVGGERHPAMEKTWFEAYYFALWVGARLPSEAEWEYAARGGAKARLGRYFFGDNPEDLPDHAWFDESGRIEAHPVDEINPRTGKENLNPLGLANMLGNVLEWVADDWHGDYEDAPDDGQPWIETPRVAFRVLRGGSWYNGCRYCRSAARYDFAPGNRNKGIGFRLARSVAIGP